MPENAGQQGSPNPNNPSQTNEVELVLTDKAKANKYFSHLFEYADEAEELEPYNFYTFLYVKKPVKDPIPLFFCAGINEKGTVFAGYNLHEIPPMSAPRIISALEDLAEQVLKPRKMEAKDIMSYLKPLEPFIRSYKINYIKPPMLKIKPGMAVKANYMFNMLFQENQDNQQADNQSGQQNVFGDSI